jgi:hypothetical protein
MGARDWALDNDSGLGIGARDSDSGQILGRTAFGPRRTRSQPCSHQPANYSLFDAALICSR